MPAVPAIERRLEDAAGEVSEVAEDSASVRCRWFSRGRCVLLLSVYAAAVFAVVGVGWCVRLLVMVPVAVSVVSVDIRLGGCFLFRVASFSRMEVQPRFQQGRQ